MVRLVGANPLAPGSKSCKIHVHLCAAAPCIGSLCFLSVCQTRLAAVGPRRELELVPTARPCPFCAWGWMIPHLGADSLLSSVSKPGAVSSN